MPDLHEHTTGEKERQEKELTALDARLARAAREEGAPIRRQNAGHALGLAWRLSLELVSCLVAGGALGWFLDWLTGFSPLFLLLFFFLGIGAGIMTVIRTATEMQKEQ